MLIFIMFMYSFFVKHFRYQDASLYNSNGSAGYLRSTDSLFEMYYVHSVHLESTFLVGVDEWFSTLHIFPVRVKVEDELGKN